MPRQWTETIADWPKLNGHETYPCLIISIERLTDPSRMRATLQHADNKQQGRTHVVDLPLPIRPDGLTASLIKAAGHEVAVGTKVKPMELTGKSVGVRFRRTDTSNCVPYMFDSIASSSQLTHGDNNGTTQSDAAS